MLARLRFLLRMFRRPETVQAEIEEEFRFHLERRTDHYLRAGMKPAEAARRARLEFGNLDRYREESRATLRIPTGTGLQTDVRIAVRSLARTPGFAAVAILTLAIGVGANASVFSLLNATVLRPLPYTEPDRLVTLVQEWQTSSQPWQATRWSYPEFEAVRSELNTLSGLAAWYATDLNLSGAGMEASRIRTEFVSASYFEVLDIAPAIGRRFVPADDDRGDGPVVIISHDVWSTQFGGDPTAVGQQMLINGVPAVIAGVAPPGFQGLSGSADMWVPHAAGPLAYMSDYLVSDQRFLNVVGRVRPATALEAVQADVSVTGERAAAAARSSVGSSDPDSRFRAVVLPLNEAGKDPTLIRAQIALSGAALFVLLIAMLNLASLLLARSVGRARESAVRAALGAGRFRLLRQALVEGGVIGIGGGLAGLLLGAWSVRLLAALPQMDWRVLTFAMCLSTVAGMMASLGAAVRVTRDGSTSSLQMNQRGSSFRVGSLRRPTVLTTAAVAQISLSLLLLAGAAVLVDGFRQLRGVDAGFEDTAVVAFTVSAPLTEYDENNAADLITRILNRVETVPGVQSATVSLCTPLQLCSRSQIHLPGRATEDVEVGRHYVGEDHFSTLGIPVLRGRALSERDRAGQPRVALINETAARLLWPGEDPIGRRVWFGSGGGFASPDSLTEIVGVVGDVLYGSPGEAVGPDVYTSYRQFTWPTTTVMARISTDAEAVAEPLRLAVAEVDPNLPIFDFQTLESWSAAVLADQRFATRSLSAIAMLGLLLAAVGLYGIMAWSVAQRRQEIGIRVALGASGAQVTRFILGQGSAVVICGLALGTLGALAVQQPLRALMPHAAAVAPLTIGSAAGVLLLVSLCACWVPAREAARVDPARTIAGDS